MGRRIFVSYKYSDSQVKPLFSTQGNTTVRDYVDEIAKIIEKEDNIYQGEDDGEDLSILADATIGSKLGDKIFYSSVTIVLISKGMKENKSEKDQWIPWEISYSLKEQSRDSGNSKTNAILAVVIPDEFNSYEYFINDRNCSNCQCRILKTDTLFQILKENMFNVKRPELKDCNFGNKVYFGESSYIFSVKWSDFCNKPSEYFDRAWEIRKNIDKYELVKNIKDI